MSLTNSLVSLLKITDKNEMEQAVSKLSEKTAKSLLALLMLTMNQQRIEDLVQSGIPIDFAGGSEI